MGSQPEHPLLCFGCRACVRRVLALHICLCHDAFLKVLNLNQKLLQLQVNLRFVNEEEYKEPLHS